MVNNEDLLSINKKLKNFNYWKTRIKTGKNLGEKMIGIKSLKADNRLKPRNDRI